MSAVWFWIGTVIGAVVSIFAIALAAAGSDGGKD